MQNGWVQDDFKSSFPIHIPFQNRNLYCVSKCPTGTLKSMCHKTDLLPKRLFFPKCHIREHPTILQVNWSLNPVNFLSLACFPFAFGSADPLPLPYLFSSLQRPIVLLPLYCHQSLFHRTFRGFFFRPYQLSLSINLIVLFLCLKSFHGYLMSKRCHSALKTSTQWSGLHLHFWWYFLLNLY